SMYQPVDYLSVNVVGTASVIQAIADRNRDCTLVVASSRAVYGEGEHACPKCGPVAVDRRSREQLEVGEWEVLCPWCGTGTMATPTRESFPLRPSSVYGVSKRTTEELAMLGGATFGFPVVALRYFNVYGSRQSLRNPYTGVVTAFVRALRNGRAP